MSSLALQHRVQRHRFAHHAWSALAARLPRALRSMIEIAPLPSAQQSAAERASEEAQAVREMAMNYEATDPSFAADLYAAAARHETQAGA